MRRHLGGDHARRDTKRAEPMQDRRGDAVTHDDYGINVNRVWP